MSPASTGFSPSTVDLAALRQAFGAKLQENVLLARYNAARTGGPADALLEVQSANELAETVRKLWDLGLPTEGRGGLAILGGGSNVLISDAGFRGVVVINRARQVVFDDQAEPPTMWCESGANFGLVARLAAARGLSGLEWAANIPGTVGGAVYGNAGAYGSDMASCLIVAEILHHGYWDPQDPPRREKLTMQRLDFRYRSSLLKRRPGRAIVLSALIGLGRGSPEKIQKKIASQTDHRRRTQPPGASMGSMFKNPTGDHAGRLIEAAGLKGLRIGEAEISTLHANFFINLGNARAADIMALIQAAHSAVAEKSGVDLELEIDLLGDWEGVKAA